MEKSAKLIHGEEESAHYVHDHEKRPTTQSTLGMSTGQSNSSFKLLCLCRTTTLYIRAKNTTHQYQYFLANKQNTEAKIDDFPWKVFTFPSARIPRGILQNQPAISVQRC